MAGGPYKNKAGTYFIVWTDSSRPHTQTKESLKTDKITVARRRKSELEQAYYKGDHDPWAKKWYERTSGRDIYVLADAVAEYIRFKTAQKGAKGWKSQRTITSHRQVIEKFSRFVGEATPLSMISEEHLHDFYHRPGITSDYTRKSYQAKVSAFIRWLHDTGLIDHRPRAEVNRPQAEVKEYIRDEKLQQIFSTLERMQSEASPSKHAGFTFDTTWYADWCRFALETGLRTIEMMRIRTTDITASDIIVGKSFTVKTRHQRKVPLSPEAGHIARKYKDNQLRESDHFMSKTTLLWGRKSLKTRSRISEALKAAAKKHGIYLTAGELRHLFAMRYLMRAEGDDSLRLLRLMKIMGHTNLKTTQNYLTYLPSDGVF